MTWTYDAAGQLVAASDGTAYTYTPTGLVATAASPTGAITYTRDAAGRVTSLGYPGGQTVAYSFDAAGQMVGATDWDSRAYTWGWTADGQLASAAYPDGTTTTVDHDTTGQPTAITVADSTGTALLALGYTWDDATQMTGQTATRSATGRSPPQGSTTTAGYAFDPLGRLTQVTGNDAGTFTWDTTGLLTATADGRSLTWQAGRLTVVADPTTPGTTTLGYDARGNRTTAQLTTPARTTTSTMGWDAADRLVSLSTPTTDYTYGYAASGLRTSTTTTTGGTTSTEQYTWDVTRAVPTLLADTSHRYLYGPDDTPVAQTDTTTSNTVWLHTDLIGSVRAVTDTHGKVLCDADYDPYGQPTTTCQDTTRFGYAGEQTDPTGLIYLRHRYYDPTTTTFLSVDPLVEATGDPYGYAAGNPLQRTDPLGLDWLSWTDDWIRPAANFSAGFGDTLSFGATRWVRQRMGTDEVVNACSGYYTWGGYTGIAVSFAIPVGGGIKAVASATRTVKAVDQFTTVVKAAEESDHIVLGLRAHGLEGTAAKVGGRTLLKDPDWMASLQRGIADPSTKFTVSLDGMSGSSTYQQVMGAASRGASGAGGYTDWEMAQLFQGERLSDVNFVRGGLPVENPWVP